MVTAQTWGELSPTEYLGHQHIAGDLLVLTISEIYPVVKENGKTGAEIKFSDSPLKYACPKANQAILIACFGDSPTRCIGKRVAWGKDKDTFGGAEVDCIRIVAAEGLREPIDVVVKYTKKTGRKPRTYHVEPLVTSMSDEELASALHVVETAADLEVLLPTMRSKPWSREQAARIGEAVKARRAGK